MKTTNQLWLVIMLMISVKLQAQLVSAKPDEFAEIKSRPLIVELIEEDEKLMESFNKKLERAKNQEQTDEINQEITEYKAFIESYNKFVSEAAKKFFTLNPSIDFKTVSEVEELRDAKSSDFTVLFFSESSREMNVYGARYTPDLSIPTLNYSRIEKGKVRVDYSFFMPYTGQREDNSITLADFAIAFKLMQGHIAAIESIGKKRYDFKAYAMDQAEANCGDLSDFPLNVDEQLIHKGTTSEEIGSSYDGTINFVSNDKMVELAENETDELISLAIPLTIVGGSAGSSRFSVTSSRITFMRCFANANTGDIYSSKGVRMGEMNDQFFRAKEFEKLGCN